MVADILREELATSQNREEIALVIERTPVPSGKSPLTPIASNDTYFYPVQRALSFYPNKNENGCAWIEEEIAALINATDDELHFTGKLANLNHNKTKNVGTIKQQILIPGVGVDVMTRVDKRAIEAQNLTPDDFRPDGEYNAASIEIYANFGRSKWIVERNPGQPLTKQQVFSAEEAAALGFRRSLPNDPQGEFRYDGFKVVEAPRPLRLRGIAFTDNPADLTSRTFELAAERGAVERPDNNPASQPNTPKESHMTDEEIAKKIADAVAAAKVGLEAELTTLRTNLTTAKTDAESEKTRILGEHTAQLDALTADITAAKDAATKAREELADRIKTDLANARFGALAKVAGFEPGTDEEKAELLKTLRDEDATAFSVRILTAQNTALRTMVEKGLPKTETDEEKAERLNREEIAALTGIDAFPTYRNAGTDKTKADPRDLL